VSTFVKLGPVRQEQFDWGTIGWRLVPATGARQLVVMDVVLDPGGGHDFHSHPDQEEMIIVQSGEIIQFIELVPFAAITRDTAARSRAAGRDPPPGS
jgi:oxalate decarboxylase/phosphoglucose isomerase-like protein (cupin superfamily)